MSWGLITAMGHVALRTTDLEASIHDAVDVLGLRVTERRPGTAYLAAGGVHHELRYIESDSSGLEALGLVARDGDALAEARRRVEEAGFRILAHRPLPDGVDDGFAFVGPEGFVFEVIHGMAPNRPEKLSFGPNRYGHFNFHPEDPTGMKDFLVDVLEFRVSDIVGQDYAYFLRCNTEHHGIAIIKGNGRFHHHAWEAQSVTELTKLGDRLHVLGRELLWGPVRHGAGNNIAVYYLEHTGAITELYTDIEHIYDDDRPPVVWRNGDVWWNDWNEYVPPDFRKLGIPPAPAVDGTL